MSHFRLLFSVVLLFFSIIPVNARDNFPDPSWSPEHPSQRSGEYIGTIIIPSINIYESIYEGVHNSVIDKGVAHWAGSPNAGEVGNSLLGAHRVLTRGKERPGPFRRLHELSAGSLIYYQYKDSEFYLYTVLEKKVISKSDVSEAIEPTISTDTKFLTLFTCHPPGQNDHRLIIRAEMIEADE